MERLLGWSRIIIMPTLKALLCLGISTVPSANGNVTSRRLRDANTIGFTYDALNRVTAKDLPGSEPDVSYAYDLLGRTTSAATSSQAYSFTYDALGRNLTQVGPNETLTSSRDTAGRRTRLTHPDGFYVDQDYFVTDELQKVREKGATSGVRLLATDAHDGLPPHGR
jgi:YD repeat-containing protein